MPVFNAPLLRPAQERLPEFRTNNRSGQWALGKSQRDRLETLCVCPAFA